MNAPHPLRLDLLRRVADRAECLPDALAYREVDSGAAEGDLTYGALLQRVEARAAALRDSVAPGSVVLLVAPNTCDFPIAFLAILAAGCDVFPVSPDLTAPELLSAAQ